VQVGVTIALIKVVRAAEAQSELSDICVVRGLADLDSTISGYTRAFMAHRWR
jgi:hypothetical protein